MPKPWAADSPVADYLRHKQFYSWIALPASQALSPRLPATVTRHFQVMSDGIAWLNGVLLAERHKQQEQSRPRRPEPMW